jgi:hypothetical protein
MNYPAEKFGERAFLLSEMDDLPSSMCFQMQVLGTMPSDKSTLLAALEYLSIVYHVRIVPDAPR